MKLLTHFFDSIITGLWCMAMAPLTFSLYIIANIFINLKKETKCLANPDQRN